MSNLADELTVIRRLLNTEKYSVRLDVAENGVRVLFEDADGRFGEVTLTVVAATFPENRRMAPRPQSARFESQPSWSMTDLKARKLPLYWNRGYLVERLSHHRNLINSVADEFSVSDDEIRRFKKLHDIDNARHEWIALEWRTGDYDTQQELADAVGESKSVVSKIVGGITADSKATWKLIHRSQIKQLIINAASDRQIYTELQTAGLTQSFDKVYYFIARLRQEVSRSE